MAKYNIDPTKSWMIGDQPRDIEAGKKAGLKTIFISENKKVTIAEANTTSLINAVSFVN